ncbi:MAG: SCP2 sterol-binding domain-containing protein [Candidatus Lokiarchaeota archaeon]|nr:SCP2 sterol-binding domain-containing protein [Candidatus Lokiarchaeota archaeon]
MLDSKSFNSVIHELENNDEEFITALDRVISFAINIVRDTEELREEIIDYDDIYQILLTDINFNFWFKVSNGSIVYKKGINRSATFKVRYTKDIFIKILKRDIEGTDAFMKGKIKIDGNLSEGLRFIKIFRLFIKYIEKGMRKI